MPDRDTQKETRDRRDDKATKPAGQEVAPPAERVDDEVDSDQAKKTKRQE